MTCVLYAAPCAIVLLLNSRSLIESTNALKALSKTQIRRAEEKGGGGFNRSVGRISITI